jgi:hypothetical protein
MNLIKFIRHTSLLRYMLKHYHSDPATRHGFFKTIGDIVKSDGIILPDTNILNPWIIEPLPYIKNIDSDVAISQGFAYVREAQNISQETFEKAVLSNLSYLWGIGNLLCSKNTIIYDGVYQEAEKHIEKRQIREIIGYLTGKEGIEAILPNNLKWVNVLKTNKDRKNQFLHEADYLLTRHETLEEVANAGRVYSLREKYAQIIPQLASSTGPSVIDSGLVLLAYQIAEEKREKITVLSNDKHMPSVYKKIIDASRSGQIEINPEVFKRYIFLNKGYHDHVILKDEEGVLKPAHVQRRRMEIIQIAA